MNSINAQTFKEAFLQGGLQTLPSWNESIQNTIFFAAAELDFWRISIDCKGASTKAGVLTRIADTLQFPDYFGMNLDALHDCLTDQLLDSGKKGAVIILKGLRENESGPESATIKAMNRALLGVFEDAVDFLADRKFKLTVLH
ncbi:MAG: barstar family protein [Burkholderiaceae bacterium]|nr:barstar family protein [Burkholderiaceae bacterium]